MAENEKTQTGTESSSSAPEVKTPFNPFLKLSIEEITALISKFPKAWKDAHAVQLSLAQTEHGVSDNEAVFLVWLQDEAAGILDRKKVSTAVGQIVPLVASVGGTQSKLALDLIEGAYLALPLELRPEVGKRIRDQILKSMVSAIAEAKLQILYSHLKITEKAWMR